MKNLRIAIRKLITESMNMVPNISTHNKRENLRRYVEDSIDLTGYGDYANTQESHLLQAIVSIFKEEKGWDIKAKGIKNAFIDYLRGMPSILDIATYYDEIRNLLYSLGYDEVKNMEDEDIDKLYYNELFNVFFNH